MKSPKTALLVGIILLLAILAYVFVGKNLKKNTTTAQNEAVQAEAEGQYPAAKSDSFSVGSLDGGKDQGNLSPEQAMVNRGKAFLLKRVDIRIGQLGPFKGKIESMPSLSDNDKKSLVTELTAEINAFEVLKAEIQDSATKADVEKVADKVKAEWVKSRQIVEHANGLALAAKETKLISDADTASLSMKKKIEALKAEGKDAKPFEDMLADYSKKVASAKQDVESAIEKSKAVASATSGAEKEKLVNEKNQLLKSSQENLRDAYKTVADEARKDFDRRMK